MKSKTTFFFCLVLLAAGVFSGCGSETPPPAEVIRPVRYQQVQLSSGNSVRTFSGVSRAETQTKLSFRVSGTLLQIKAKVGQQVKKGDLIAAIDDTDMKLQLADARAGLENARVQLETARANLGRVRELYENNNIALSDYEGAKNQYASARANRESAQKQLDLQKRQLSYSRLYSPVDGFVASVPVEKNENVQSGEAIVTLTSGNHIDVEVGMPGAFIYFVKVGMDTSVRFATDTAEISPGSVIKVSHVSSAASTYPVTVRLGRVTERIRPGMPAEVTFNFDTGEKKPHIFVPGNSVAEDTSGRFVFVVVPGPEKGFAIVHKRPVEVGNLTGEGFEILKGLTAGDFIVTAGISKLTDGMKVRLPG